MSGHVFRVVSGAPSRTLLTSLWLATGPTPWVSATATLGAAGVGFVFLGIPTYGHVALNSFLKFGQGGLVDWSQRWPALISCVRPWGIPMLQSYVFELISQDSEHCTNRQGRLGACQGEPGWISVAQVFRPFGHVALNSFLKFGQGGLVDWSRRWPALVSCVRPWGFRCFGHMSLNSFPKTRSTAPTDKVVKWLAKVSRDGFQLLRDSDRLVMWL